MELNSFIYNFWVVLTSNVKMDQCCPQLRFFILMVRLVCMHVNIYHSRFIPDRVAEALQIFLRDAHVLQKLLSYENYCKRDR
jgi:hypothetical protein